MNLLQKPKQLFKNCILLLLGTSFGAAHKDVGLRTTQSRSDRMAKKEYFPNNWQVYKDADDSNFIPHTFEEVMTWKIAGWELPDSVCCIVRVNDYDTHKVTEHVYQKRSAAQAKINTLLGKNCEFIVCDHEAVHHLYPQP